MSSTGGMNRACHGTAQFGRNSTNPCMVGSLSTTTILARPLAPCMFTTTTTTTSTPSATTTTTDNGQPHERKARAAPAAPIRPPLPPAIGPTPPMPTPSTTRRQTPTAPPSPTPTPSPATTPASAPPSAPTPAYIRPAPSPPPPSSPAGDGTEPDACKTRRVERGTRGRPRLESKARQVPGKGKRWRRVRRDDAREREMVRRGEAAGEWPNERKRGESKSRRERRTGGEAR
ncbi:hypothetical protein CPC08DRAFT_771582 [Agrocybe pediades]|nr:hypothetical protein CPC08DRAFT_771582 [Agrocybe pediades]